MNRCESITSQTIVRHYKLESREGDGMKGGKGNTFSTSLNKSFFLSFFFSSSSPKIDQSQFTIENTRKRWANKRMCARNRSCNANRHTCRRSTCNKVENDLVNETQDNE
jgi:hypothetical protein